MAEVSSPQVIVSEVDVSTVAPAISSSIAAIVGGSTKGPVNEPTFISTPNEFTETFGNPVTTSFMGYAAINFLRQGNQLWVNRIASLAGDDPVATANTDTRASITSGAFTAFNFTGSLELQFDGSNSITINFSPANTNSISDIVSTINTALKSVSPKLGTASVTDTNKVKIESFSKNGPLSTISVLSTDVAQFSGKSGTGARTVSTVEALTSAAVTSTNNSATIDTTVVFASVMGNTYTAGELFNVSKQPQEAYGVVSVDSNSTFTEGSYNTLTFTVNSIPTNDATFTVGGLAAITIDVAGGTDSTTNIDASGFVTASDLASAIAKWINRVQDYSAIGGGANNGDTIPSAGVTATAANNVVTLKQIDPDNSQAVTVIVTDTADDGWATLVGSVTKTSGASHDGTPISSDTAGGTAGDWVSVTVPALTPAGVEDVVTYYFLAGDSPGFDASSSISVTAIASSLATAIDSRDSYYPNSETLVGGPGTAKTYALSSTSSNNKVTITTNGNLSSGLVAEGNTITVDLSNLAGSSISADDLGGSGELQHGFNERAGTANSEYAFGTITVDGVAKSINFDTISASILPDKHEATLQQIANAINYAFGAIVAGVADAGGGNEALIITSPTTGAEGTVTVGQSSNFDTTSPVAQNNDDPFEVSGSFTLTSGSGDNHLAFTIDDTYNVDVYFTQSATLSLSQAASEINDAAGSVDDSLESIASQDGSNITITSPTTGDPNYGFSSSVIVTNALTGVFNDVSLHEGTGQKFEAITITAASPGSWANDTITVSFRDEDPLFFASNSSRVDVYLSGSLVETFREVVLDPSADGTTGVGGQGTFIEKAINPQDGVGGSSYITVDFDDDVSDSDPDTFTNSVKILQNTGSTGSNPPYKLSGGGDGIDGLTDSDVIGVPSDPGTGDPTGLQVYADPEKVFINLLAAPGFSSQAVGNELVTIAEARQDTLAIVDPPLGLTPSQVTDWHNGQGYGRTSALNTSYAALYGSWVKQFDNFNNVNVDVPPSVQLLAQFAYNDAVSEPWFATAGLTRGRLTTALDVINNPSLGQRELMLGQGNRVNPIVNFTQDGIVVWGNSTLYRQESALSEISVRRLLNFAKVTISLAAKVILFEPNDPTTSKRLLEIINPILYSIRTRRGLSEFKVVDDTTDNDRNLGRMVIRIFLRPTRSVKVIKIPFIVTKEGGSFAI